MLTEAEKLEIAREAEALIAESVGLTIAAAQYREGTFDASPAIQGGIRALTLADQRRGGGDYVWLPREPTEEMWDGLARQIVMWTRFGRPTGAALHDHLKSTGWAVPDWLAAEIPDVDHVPPKGTVAAVIYRIMVEAFAAAPASRQGEGQDQEGASLLALDDLACKEAANSAWQISEERNTYRDGYHNGVIAMAGKVRSHIRIIRPDIDAVADKTRAPVVHPLPDQGGK